MQTVELIAEVLRQEGVSEFACFPTSPVIEALAEAGIRPVVCRQERTGVHIADGLVRASGARRTGVFAMQFGPGVENAFPGVATAWSDGTPLLLLPLGHPLDRHGVPGMSDPLRALEPYCVHVERLTRPERAVPALRRAFGHLRNGRGGPVAIEVPWDIATAEVEGAEDWHPVPALRSAGDPGDIERVADAIVAAQRPVILAGQGVRYAHAEAALAALAEALAIPVATTLAGKGVFDERHPLALGTGGVGIPGPLRRFMEQADLVIGVGTSLSRHYMTVKIPPGRRIVQLTARGEDVGREYPVEAAVVGDAALVLPALTECCLARSHRRRALDAVAAAIAAERDAWIAEWRPKLTSGARPIDPYRVIHELGQVLPAGETIVTHDSGSPRDQVTPFYRSAVGGYLSWGKSHALGTGLGLAMGAKLAHPQRHCVAIMGDAAFGMVGLDFETAVRACIPVICIVLNNGTMAVETDSMARSHARFGTRDLGGDYAAVATALGGAARRVEDPAGIAEALRWAGRTTRDDGRPVLLEFITAAETAVSHRAAFGLV